MATAAIGRRGPTASQINARRNLAWLSATTIGRPNPITGRMERASVRELAQEYRRSEETVRQGIAAARRDQERVRHATEGDE